jgi:CubicO group peptidase (beta-lactamase class C family)
VATNLELTDLAGRTAETLAARHAGAVVAAVRGDDVAFGAAGRTGGPDDRRPDPRTMFEIGSVTKVVTALVLARRAAAGELDLDQPVRTLLPAGATVPARDGREITLRHLATHTSGLPRLPKGAFTPSMLWSPPADPYARFTADVVLDGLARTRLRAAPGAKFRYSNLGAGLLGLALATAAGTDYETVATREVCGPLGLTDTIVTLDGERAARFAHGHNARGAPAGPWHLAALAGAGALRSTATDMAAFLRATMRAWDGDDPGGLGAAVRVARDVVHPINRWTWIHLGWMGLRLHPRFGSAHQIWHNGGTGGFRSWLGFIPEKRTGVAVLTNTTRSPDAPAFDLLRVLSFGGDLRAR